MGYEAVLEEKQGKWWVGMESGHRVEVGTRERHKMVGRKLGVREEGRDEEEDETRDGFEGNTV